MTSTQSDEKGKKKTIGIIPDLTTIHTPPREEENVETIK
jgi:hypothetical protein